MKAMKPIKVCSAKDQSEARMLIGLLEKNGIAVYSQGEGSGGYMDIYAGVSVYGENIFADEADADRAKELIREVTQAVGEELQERIDGTPSKAEESIGRRKKGNQILAFLLATLLILGIFFTIQRALACEKVYKPQVLSLKTPIGQAAQMADEELYNTIVEEMVEVLDRYENPMELLYGAQKVFYVLDYFDLEVQNGGLCQFYVNSSKAAAPYVSEALEEIGAQDYRCLFDEFNEKAGIDTEDLSSFSIQKLEEFHVKNANYPFGEFNKAYLRLCETKPLNRMLIRYVREHLEDFYL